MKTRKRKAALKRTAMSGFCQKKKMELARNAGLNHRVLEWEKTSRVFGAHSGSSCLLSLHFYDRGLYLCWKHTLPWNIYSFKNRVFNNKEYHATSVFVPDGPAFTARTANIHHIENKIVLFITRLTCAVWNIHNSSVEERDEKKLIAFRRCKSDMHD